MRWLAGDRKMTAAPAPRSTARASTARPAAAQPASQIYLAPRAVEQALEKETISVDLPEPIGTVRLPSPQRLAFYRGIAAPRVFGIVYWPAVLVIRICD